MSDDPFQLQRFIQAQERVYPQVCDELSGGKKRSHWMWFIFPQIRGLGSSETAQRYAISSLKEAEAYLAHPILGARVRECTELVVGVENRTATQIFGYPDDLKFKSSMTLFSRATAENQIYVQAIDKYFGGEADSLTLARIEYPSPHTDCSNGPSNGPGNPLKMQPL
jgi:uncharacterized protein (DUF1810 family)